MSDSAVSPITAAALLGTSAPTIRRLVDRGELRATTETHGRREWVLIDRDSVNAYLAAHGRFERRRAQPAVADLARDVAALRELIAGPVDPGAAAAMRERDDLRAENVALREMILQLRGAAELQREADRARSESGDHLRNAIAASDRASSLLAEVAEKLSEATTATVLPGHLGSGAA